MACLFLLLVASIAAASAYCSGWRHSGCPRSYQPANEAATEDGNTCGISQVAPILASPGVTNGLGSGGDPAKPHSWPWLVSIQSRDFIRGNRWSHMCPGTLISPRIVKTNGYCIQNYALLGDASPFNWLVTLGPHNSSVLANVNTSVTIESWIGQTITLSKDVPENPYIKSICYGKATFPVGYRDCYISGWSNEETKVTDGGLVGNANLSQAQAAIVSLDDYRRETGFNVSQWSVDIAVEILSAGGFPAWRSLGAPLMCRNWCNADASGQWFLLGHANGYAIRKSLFTNKTYAIFVPLS